MVVVVTTDLCRKESFKIVQIRPKIELTRPNSQIYKKERLYELLPIEAKE
jgi:hypothetical protein